MQKPSFTTKINFHNLNAPKEIREKIWYILELIKDEGLIIREGGHPTKITFHPYEGYGDYIAIGIITAAAYLATTDDKGLNSILKLLGKKIEVLQLNSKSSVTLTIEVTNHLDTFKDDFDQGFQYMVEVYTRITSINYLQKLVENGFKYYGYNIMIYKKWRNEAIEAVRRLKFHHDTIKADAIDNPEVHFIAPFEVAIRATDAVNKKLQLERDFCENLIREFEKNTPDFGADDVAPRFEDIIKKIEEAIQKFEIAQLLLCRPIDNLHLRELLNEVRLNTPPAPIIMLTK